MRLSVIICLQCCIILLTIFTCFFITDYKMTRYSQEILEMNRKPYVMFIEMIKEMNGEK